VQHAFCWQKCSPKEEEDSCHNNESCATPHQTAHDQNILQKQGLQARRHWQCRKTTRALSWVEAEPPPPGPSSSAAGELNAQIMQHSTRPCAATGAGMSLQAITVIFQRLLHADNLGYQLCISLYIYVIHLKHPKGTCLDSPAVLHAGSSTCNLAAHEMLLVAAALHCDNNQSRGHTRRMKSEEQVTSTIALMGLSTRSRPTRAEMCSGEAAHQPT
jgi:hypothetical protein